MKLLTFAASNSKQSINKQLVKYAASRIADVNIDYVDINDFDLPIYNIDLEEEYGIPTAAHSFAKNIAEADAVLISLAEHNGNYTVAFKNLFDWLSRIDRNVYQSKPLVLLATSPGPGGAKNVLKLAVEAAPHFGGNLIGQLSIPSFYDNFSTEEQRLINQDLDDQLTELLRHLESITASKEFQD